MFPTDVVTFTSAALIVILRSCSSPQTRTTAPPCESTVRDRTLGKRGHRRQRVHVVAPTHNLPIFNRDNRDEAVFVKLAGANCVALNFILEDDDAGSLGNVHHERVCAMRAPSVRF